MSAILRNKVKHPSDYCFLLTFTKVVLGKQYYFSYFLVFYWSLQMNRVYKRCWTVSKPCVGNRNCHLIQKKGYSFS